MVNCMTTKMTLESENMEEIVEKVKKLVNEVEPDVNMVKAQLNFNRMVGVL